jgi:hypothetical protein
MKHRYDDRQIDMFAVANDAGPPDVVVGPLEPSPFDLSKLRVTEHEGVPYVLDLDLAAALNRPVAYVRQWQRRLKTHAGWGSCFQYEKMIVVGKGAHRFETVNRFTEKQVILICMRSELPNIEEVQSLIADVFIAWRHGKLRAADAETEVKLQEATDRALDDMPSLFTFMAKFERRVVAAVEDGKRKYPSKQTCCDARWVQKHNYRDRCPCCQRIVLGPNGGEWGHMKQKHRASIRDGWFVCRKCNLDWENSLNTNKILDKFRTYIQHVEAYLAQEGRSF